MGAKTPVLAALAVSCVLAPLIALIGLRVPLWLILTAAPLAGAETRLYNALIVLVTTAACVSLPAPGSCSTGSFPSARAFVCKLRRLPAPPLAFAPVRP